MKISNLRKIILLIFTLIVCLFFILVNFLETKKIYSLPNLLCSISVKMDINKFNKYCSLSYDLIKSHDQNLDIIFEDHHKISLKKNDQNLSSLSNFTFAFRNHANYQSNNFFMTDKINKKNIKNYKIHWSYQYQNIGNYNIQASPLYYDGIIITPQSKNSIIGIDFETKQKIWEVEYQGPIARRGMVIDKYEKKNALFINYKEGLLILDIYSGKILKEIKHNSIKAVQVITKYSTLKELESKLSLVPPIITKNHLIISYTNSEIIKYDIKTEKVIWKTSLRKKDNLLGTSNWGGMSYDNDTEIIYITTGNPRSKSLSNFPIGIYREGSNLYSNSLVAIDSNTGEVLWYYQDAIHDLWDLDLSFPPIISEIEVSDKIKKRVVVIVGKTGNIMVFDAISGESIHKYSKVITPKSSIPGEVLSSYQPVSINPEKILNMKINKEELANFNDEIFDYNLKIFNKSSSEEYIAPIFNENIVVRGPTGGGQWFGGSIDNQGILYFQSNNSPFQISLSSKQLIENILENNGREKYKKYCSSCHGVNRDKSPIEKPNISLAGLSLVKYFDKKSYKERVNKIHNDEIKANDLDDIIDYLMLEDKEVSKLNGIVFTSDFGYFEDQYGNLATSPPYSFIYAVDVKSGKILWKKSIGEIEINLGNGNKTYAKGSPSYGGLITNKNLIFASGYYDSKFYILDKKDGSVIKSIQMQSPGSSPSIIFEHKKRKYIAVNATGTLKSKAKEPQLVIFGYKGN